MNTKNNLALKKSAQVIKKTNPLDVSKNKQSEFPNDPFLKETKRRIGKVAIVIDDLGYDMNIVEKLLQLNAPISFSILPGLRYSRAVAQKAFEQNRDVLLHLPMEPDNYPQRDPGPGALFDEMSSEELEEQLLKDLEAIPHMMGSNNHMGSKLTENEKIMHSVMKIIKERNLFFLDSLTSPDSVAYKVAKEYGIKAAKRNIFLDNEKSVELISRQIIKLGETALKNGYAIGIGHPHKNTLLALHQTLPELIGRGIKIVPVSQLVN